MIRFDIALSIEEADAEDGQAPFSATVTASGTEVVVTVSDATRLPRSGRRMLGELLPLADGLASRGVSVRVEGPDGLLVAVGDVHATAVQRLVTRSPHVRLGSLGALAHVGRGAPLAGVALPPATLLPIAPTLGRSARRWHATTTHAQPGAGRPRLIFAGGDGGWDGGPPRVFDLLPEITRIGSGPDVDLRLEGLEGVHAEIRHRGDDEYVLHPIAPTGGGSGTGPDALMQERILRTGARIELGGWRLAYYREEFADHGRPYGGRQGGELSLQRRQPPRPR
ncbi:hypothetical protein GCM10009846_08680 [Agrococcus versicolor]|uniref:FHA domain-containing protein n=1 Tax=Agrococcus versicolor TaxID=501482 RepID=A0ABP5MGN5_9MICO